MPPPPPPFVPASQDTPRSQQVSQSLVNKLRNVGQRSSVCPSYRTSLLDRPARAARRTSGARPRLETAVWTCDRWRLEGDGCPVRLPAALRSLEIRGRLLSRPPPCPAVVCHHCPAVAAAGWGRWAAWALGQHCVHAPANSLYNLGTPSQHCDRFRQNQTDLHLRLIIANNRDDARFCSLLPQ